MISPIASGGPWICKHPCYKELNRVQEIHNELQTLDIKLRGKIGSTYGVESIPITFRVEIIQDHLSPLWKIKQHLEPSKLYHCIKITHHLFTVCASSTTKATRLEHLSVLLICQQGFWTNVNKLSISIKYLLNRNLLVNTTTYNYNRKIILKAIVLIFHK